MTIQILLIGFSLGCVCFTFGLILDLKRRYGNKWADHIGTLVGVVAAVMVTIMFVAAAAISTTLYATNQRTCIDNGQTMHVATEYKGNLQGCFIRYKGQWIPWGKWLVIR